MSYTPSVKTTLTLVPPYTLQRAGVSAPSVFTPASVSQLMVWFSGDVGLTTSIWRNQGLSGTSSDVTSFSGMNIVTVNGLPAARFGQYGYGAFNMFLGSDSRSMFCVFKSDTQMNNVDSINITSQHNDGFYGGWVLAGGNSGFSHFLVSYGQALEVWNTSPFNLTTADQLNFLGSSWDTSAATSPNNYVFVNMTTKPSSWSADAGFYDGNRSTPTFLGTQLGNSPNQTIGWTLCEICIYGRALTIQEGTDVRTYLHNKWGTYPG